jgi:hypothetical protein
MSRSRRVNAHLNALHTAQKKTQANLNGFLNCIGLAPMSEYTGYAATDGVTTLNAMDYTASGTRSTRGSSVSRAAPVASPASPR